MLTALLIAVAVAAPQWAPPAEPWGHVNDFARVLDYNAVNRLEAQLTEHERQTSNQVVVVTLPTLDGKDIADVTYELGQRWKIGQHGKDNGVIFAIAPRERKMRIEVGKGLEGALTDLQTHIIQEDVVRPYFRNDRINDGIEVGTTAILQAIRGEFKAPAHTQSHGGGFPPFLIIFGFIILFIFFPRFGMLLLMSGGRGGGGGGGFSGGGGSFGGGGSSSSW